MINWIKSPNAGIAKKIFFDCFTGKNNNDFELTRFLLFFAFCIMNYFFIDNYVRTLTLHVMEYVAANGGLLTSYGITQFIKKDTEPGGQ